LNPEGGRNIILEGKRKPRILGLVAPSHIADSEPELSLPLSFDASEPNQLRLSRAPHEADIQVPADETRTLGANGLHWVTSTRKAMPLRNNPIPFPGCCSPPDTMRDCLNRLEECLCR
jgi:hypothetical protein